MWFPIVFLAASALMLFVAWCVFRGMWRAKEEEK